jgi:hypothetical protein
MLAGTTGLEPAASCVTGMRSNQLNYVPGPLCARESLTVGFIVASPVTSREVNPEPLRMVGGIRLERMTFCL